MSKVRDLPETTTLADDDILYAVDESAGPNGGRKIKKSNLKTSVAPTAAETKTAYESNADTNAFTDAEKTKLATVEAGAEFQDASEVPYSNAVSNLSATNVQNAIDEVNVNAQADFRPSIISGRILHYTGGTARFDGVFFELLAGDILLNPNIINGEVYVDLDGLVKQTGSGVLAPPFTVVFAKFSTDLNNIISLTDERVKNAQNIVRGTLADVRDVRAGAASSEGASGRISDAMHKHNVLTAQAITQAPDQANAEGTSVSLARADHVHEIPTAAPTTDLAPSIMNTEGIGTSFARGDHTHAIVTALVADITTILPDDTASAGTTDNFARGNHKHAIATSAPTTTLSPATTNAEGVGTAFTRNDHTHAIATGLVGEITTIVPDDAAAAGVVDKFARADHRHAIAASAPITQAPDQANTEGVSTSFARADHIHNIPATAPTTTLSPATTNTEGVATSFARGDHIHAIATALVGDIVTIVPDAAASAGVANTFARGDHTHAIVAAPATSISTSTTNTEGAATSFARADHTHVVTVTSSEATATVDDTTTSATDILINSMTLTPASGIYFVIWSGSIVNSANGVERTWVSLYSGGTQVSATERSIGTGGGSYTPATTQAVITVNGSQAIELRWRVAGGTSTVRSRRLTLLKIG